jgi:phosphatidate cytidylyltransferase
VTAASRPTAGKRFLSRAGMTAVLLGGFATLAWADAIGLGGALPAWWLMPLLVGLAIGGVNECVHLFAARDLLLRAWWLRMGVVAIFLSAAIASQAFVAADMSAVVAAMSYPMVVYAVTAGLLFAIEVLDYRPGSRSLERLAAGLLVLTYLGLPMAFMVGLRLLCVENLGPEQRGPGHLGILPLVSMIAVVKAGDVAAYLVGSLLGRHRMAPILSPGKTLEGLAGSLGGSLLAAWLFLGSGVMQTPGTPAGGWMLYGLTVGGAGILGDLAESLLKREAGIKDSGILLGGLGGVLDLVDSMLFAAPVAWVLWASGTIG